MKINLHDIPEHGKEFIFNEKTGELNSILSDLIGKRAYQIQVTIRPLNTRDFEMTGRVATATSEQCSRCGLDFNFEVNERCHEIIIPTQHQPRNGKYARVNHASEESSEGPGTVEHFDFYFDLGEYIHEVVGLAAPFNPAPPEDKEGNCSLCHINVKDKLFSYNEEMPEDSPKENPFSVLKGVKIN